MRLRFSDAGERISAILGPPKCPFPRKHCDFSLRRKIASDCVSCDFSRKKASPLRFGWRRGRLRQKIVAICDCGFLVLSGYRGFLDCATGRGPLQTGAYAARGHLDIRLIKCKRHFFPPPRVACRTERCLRHSWFGVVSPHLPVGKNFLRFCPVWPD